MWFKLGGVGDQQQLLSAGQPLDLHSSYSRSLGMSPLVSSRRDFSSGGCSSWFSVSDWLRLLLVGAGLVPAWAGSSSSNWWGLFLLKQPNWGEEFNEFMNWKHQIYSWILDDLKSPLYLNGASPSTSRRWWWSEAGAPVQLQRRWWANDQEGWWTRPELQPAGSEPGSGFEEHGCHTFGSAGVLVRRSTAEVTHTPQTWCVLESSTYRFVS